MKRLMIVFFIVLIFLTSYFVLNREKPVIEEIDKGIEDFKVYTSIYPIYETFKEISGNNIEPGLIVPNGTEAHSYEPSLRKMAELERADIFFYIGIGMEPWADKAKSNLMESGVKIVELNRYLDLIKMKNKYHNHDENEEYINENDYDLHNNDAYEEDDDHGEKAKNTDIIYIDNGENRGQYDPHVWLDPINMKKIAKIIKEELIRLDFENKDIYQENYNEYEKNIELLEKAYQENLSEKKKNKIIVSHGAFGYLAERFNFEQLALTGVTSHDEVTPGNIAELIKTARENEIKYIFMETLTDSRVVQVVAEEAGLEILSLNPFIGLTEKEIVNDEDYFSIMYKNLKNLEKALVE